MKQEFYKDLDKLKAELEEKCSTLNEVYICGKGPSLDNMIAELDYDLLVIGINDAAWAVEKERKDRTVLCVCQDSYDGLRVPSDEGYVLARHPIVARWCKHPKAWQFTPESFGLSTKCATVGFALEFAKFLGAKRAYMIGFDAVTDGDFSYSKKAGHERNFQIGLEASHAGLIKKHSEGLELVYMPIGYSPKEGPVMDLPKSFELSVENFTKGPEDSEPEDSEPEDSEPEDSEPNSVMDEPNSVMDEPNSVMDEPNSVMDDQEIDK